MLSNDEEDTHPASGLKLGLGLGARKRGAEGRLLVTTTRTTAVTMMPDTYRSHTAGLTSMSAYHQGSEHVGRAESV